MVGKLSIIRGKYGLIGIVTFSSVVIGETKNDLQSRVDKIEDSISEVRRDQLNYKIEKDLLKDAFSSNLKTLNLVITIVLASFTIMSFFEIRNIGELKKSDLDELNRLTAIGKELKKRYLTLTRIYKPYG